MLSPTQCLGLCEIDRYIFSASLPSSCVLRSCSTFHGVMRSEGVSSVAVYTRNFSSLYESMSNLIVAINLHGIQVMYSIASQPIDAKLPISLAVNNELLSEWLGVEARVIQ